MGDKFVASHEPMISETRDLVQSLKSRRVLFGTLNGVQLLCSKEIFSMQSMTYPFFQGSPTYCTLIQASRAPPQEFLSSCLVQFLQFSKVQCIQCSMQCSADSGVYSAVQYGVIRRSVKSRKKSQEKSPRDPRNAGSLLSRPEPINYSFNTDKSSVQYLDEKFSCNKVSDLLGAANKSL